MRHIKIIAAIACLCLTLAACKKETTENKNCESIKKALVADARDDIKTLVNAYIDQLPSKTYTSQNINAIGSIISKDCSITSQVLCFDCVFTLPSMSEIKITVTSTQPNVSRILDISYTPDNNMKCVAVHE